MLDFTSKQFDGEVFFCLSSLIYNSNQKKGSDKVYVARQTGLTIDLILMLEIIIMYESSDMDHRGLG